MIELSFLPSTVPLWTDEHGAVRFANSRVSLDSVAVRHKQGFSPEEIVECFPTLPLADVSAVVAYIASHGEEIDAYLSERESEAGAIERQWRDSWDATAYKKELLKRSSERKANHVPPLG